jgi:phosphoribosylaminoimidazole carboxylase PurE protein
MNKMMSPKVSILMGSDSDLEIMNEAAAVLAEFGVPAEVSITSAHRSPEWTRRYLKQAEADGVEVIIAGAGGAAHLAGTIAAHTQLPVIGVPIDSSSLGGLDSLLSTVQMPSGVPVATMAIGKAGAKNAGILAAQILARGDAALTAKLKAYKAKLEKQVEEKARRLRSPSA